MDSSDGCSHLPAAAPAPFPVNPLSIPDPRVPLLNLSILRKKMDSLHDFLSLSIESNSQLDDEQIGFVSMEITSAIHNIILNGAALVASSLQPSLPSGSVGNVERTGGFEGVKRTKLGEFSNMGNRLLPAAKMTDPPDVMAPACYPVPGEVSDSSVLRNIEDQKTSNAAAAVVGSANQEYPWEAANNRSTTTNLAAVELKEANLREPYQGINDDSEIIELDAVELLAEHVHFCEICGKGFKRDANLRMHMRAHGDQFKTLEALARPGKSCSGSAITKARFSCPFPGCNRNRGHKKFRPLKSAICVKNHFKRSHCPRMYLCNRCNKKSFSVVADLKSHLKHCGECRWKCSCGTTFSRKDKLFGHLALFEGHMPAVMEEEKSKQLVAEEDFFLDEEDLLDNGFFEGLLDGSDPVDSNSLEDVMGFSSLDPRAGVDKV